MPKRKGSKGGGRTAGEYSQLSEEEKRVYHTLASQVCRGKLQETKDSTVDSTVDSSEEEKSFQEPKSSGRPPLKDSAMSPHTLKERRSGQPPKDTRHQCPN